MLQAVLEPVTNREDWIEQVEVRDETNTLVDLSAATIVIAVRDRLSKVTVLNASTDDGNIVVQSLGLFQFTFELDEMRGVEIAKSYDIGCTIELAGITRQFFIGSVNVLDGIVP